jgi:hypothetical protein
MGIASMEAVIYLARTNILHAKENNAWLLTREQYETFRGYNEMLAKHGTQEQQERYLGLLQLGRLSTVDRTPAHGIFNTLLLDWQECYELVSERLFDAGLSVYLSL